MSFISSLFNPPVEFSAFFGITLLLSTLSSHEVIFISDYQFALSKLGYENYVLNAARTSFLSSNKEGIASCFGFTALYFVASQIGMFIGLLLVFNSGFYISMFSKNMKKRDTWKISVYLFLFSIACYAAGYVTEHVFMFPPSRKLVSSPTRSRRLLKGQCCLCLLFDFNLHRSPCLIDCP